MFKTRRLVQAGLLTAFGVVLEVFFAFSIFPPAPYLRYAPGDIPLLWVGYAFGPLWGVISVAVKAVLYTLMRGGDGGGWGTLMHFLASSAFVVVFSLFARQKSKSPIPTLLGLALGTLARVGIMVPANLLITPIYLKTTLEAVKELIIPIIIPFNLLHSGVNSVLFFLMRLAVGDRLSSYLLKKED